MRQKYLTILLAMLMSMVGTKVFAYDITVENADNVTIYYNYINGGTELEITRGSTSGNSYAGNVVIPESVTYDGNTYRVTSIGNNAFYRCSDLTEVIIPNSVLSIGQGAFFECGGLTEVIIPNSVISIGIAAFSYCTMISKLTIGNNVTLIAQETFYNCRNLTEVVIPNYVASIGLGAFERCEKLKKVSIGNSVMSIGSSAFQNCSSLMEINFSNSVTSIGSDAFRECISLTKIIIPNSVTSIDNNAFRECRNLIELIIGNSVTSIGDGAFRFCESLLSITSLKTPPSAIYSTTFDENIKKHATLYVPIGSKVAYIQASYWKDFLHIQEIETNDIDTVTGINKQDKTAIYTLDGKRLQITNAADLPKGIYIVNGKKVAVK